MISEPTSPSHERHVSFPEALRVFAKIALLSFGGPAGQIAVMHRLLVDEKRWISERRFLHALNYCMLLPGPEAQQLSTYVGWLLHGWRGGLAAGLLFVLPGFVAILCLSVLYAGFRDASAVEALLFGLKPAVVAIVVEAVLRIGRRALKSRAMVAIAASSFVAIFLFEVSFPVLVLSAAGVGLIGGRLRPRSFGVAAHRPVEAGEPAESEVRLGDHARGVRPSLGRAMRVALLWLAVWWLPLFALMLALGPRHVLVQEGLFFSKASVVTFGGAYAVLAYVAQQAVATFGWLQPGEMLDGLGMAETTPGPLIQVVQFVGFMGAYRNPGELDPMVAGLLGSVVVTWVTFAPCFLWIFLGAPYVEALRGSRTLSSALSAITAAVVGAILNLALWFALHTLFGDVGERHRLGMRLLVPDPATLDVAAAVLSTGAFLALLVFRVGMVWTLAGAVALGGLWHLIAR